MIPGTYRIELIKVHNSIIVMISLFAAFIGGWHLLTSNAIQGDTFIGEWQLLESSIYWSNHSNFSVECSCSLQRTSCMYIYEGHIFMCIHVLHVQVEQHNYTTFTLTLPLRKCEYNFTILHAVVAGLTYMYVDHSIQHGYKPNAHVFYIFKRSKLGKVANGKHSI